MRGVSRTVCVPRVGGNSKMVDLSVLEEGMVRDKSSGSAVGEKKMVPPYAIEVHGAFLSR